MAAWIVGVLAGNYLCIDWVIGRFIADGDKALAGGKELLPPFRYASQQPSATD